MRKGFSVKYIFTIFLFIGNFLFAAIILLKMNPTYMADVCLETHTATKNFFEISRRTKQKLGNKSYKLDEYWGGH